MTDKLKQTVRIVRQDKVITDDRGRTVWNTPIEPTKLDLVTTTMLKRVLSSDDDNKKQNLREAAAGKEGVLAHDPDLGRFEIIDDTDLQEILETVQNVEEHIHPADVILEPLASRADIEDEELSLVSTLALRQLIDHTDQASEDEELEVDDTGFDPYNTG
jgi:hypothetical protein